MSRLVPRRITKNISTSELAEFQRQELKYLVPNALIDILIPELLNHLVPDHYSQNGFYPIHSVYFDTQDWQAFYAKLDGVERRQKFRLRSYFPTPAAEDNVFVEIKEKRGNTVLKRRTPLSMHKISQLLQGQPLDHHNKVYQEWRYNLLRNALKPKLLNTYDRYAFESPHFPGLRITLDRNVAYCMTQSVDFNLPTRGVTWSHTYSVVEVKFDRYVPRFVVEMLRRYNMTMTPVSKYCDSVIANYLLI